MSEKEQTNLVKPEQKQTRMVRVQVKSPIRTSEGKTFKEGSVCEISEEDAKEFCDKKFENVYAFSGERDSDDAPRGKIIRAVRL